MQCEVTEFLGRQETFTGNIIHYILFFPAFNSHSCLLPVPGRSKCRIMRHRVVSSDRVLYLIQHSFRIRAFIIPECCCKDGTLCLRRHGVEHLFQPGVAALEYALVHDALQIVLGFGSNCAFAVKRTLVLCRSNVAALMHPTQSLCSVCIHQAGKRSLIVHGTEQQVGERAHFRAHFPDGVLGLDPLDTTAFNVLCNELPKRNCIRIFHIEHIHQHGTLHCVDLLGFQSKLVGMLFNVLLVLFCLLRMAIPHLTQGGTAVVALYHFSAHIHCRRTRIGSYGRRDFFGSDISCYFVGREYACSVVSLFGLSLVYEVHRVADTSQMTWLQLVNFNDCDTTTRDDVVAEFHFYRLATQSRYRLLSVNLIAVYPAIASRPCVLRGVVHDVGNTIERFTSDALLFLTLRPELFIFNLLECSSFLGLSSALCFFFCLSATGCSGDTLPYLYLLFCLLYGRLSFPLRRNLFSNGYTAFRLRFLDLF